MPAPDFAEPVIGRRSAPTRWLIRATSAPLFASYLLPGSEITRLATSLFQMNSTTSAPIVAVMKPAP